MLAREELGRRHQRGLAFRLDDGGGGEQRHDGLARADVALQQAQHALRPSEVGDDLLDRMPLRRRQRVGQGGDDALAQPPVAGHPPAGRPAHMRAHHAEGELARQQFVIGEPRPRRSVGLHVGRLVRPMQRLDRRLERWPFLARDPRPILPFGKVRHLRQGRGERLAQLRHGQAFGQRIGRLDQRQLAEIFWMNDAVRMHHLQHAVVERDGAGHVAHLADRIELLQVASR